MSSMSPQLQHQAYEHEYECAPSGASRSPCPALNTLANHGFIHRAGSNLKFFDVLRAIVLVYNFSYPLAFLLTSLGFVTCGKVSFNNSELSKETPNSQVETATSPLRRIWLFLHFLISSLTLLVPSFTLDLQALSTRGGIRIAHDASLVHLNEKESTSPDPTLLHSLVHYARETRNLCGSPKGGLGLSDLAAYHAQRCRASATLDKLHTQIALGECSLTWKMLSNRPNSIEELAEGGDDDDENLEGVIPVSRLEQWFGEERLPDNWWGVDSVRPIRTVSVARARRLANLIDELGK